MKTTIKIKLHELYYWKVLRPAQKFIPWVARKLPERVKYFVVIDGMVNVEPDNDPSDVTGMQMLELWKKKVENV